MQLRVVNLEEKFSRFSDCWHPRIVGELNGQQIKIARLKGEFVWHHHENGDELFWVVEGQLRMKYRPPGGGEREAVIREGEFFIVPRGIEHLPIADEECRVMLLEPVGTQNTGNLSNERTVPAPEYL